MMYKYITDNNLYEKQNYMYSEYGGRDFLREYLAVREHYMQDSKVIQKSVEISSPVGESKTCKELKKLWEMLKNNLSDKKAKKAIDAYVKSFEVRKRIYTEYTKEWKPTENAGFEDYDSYLLLGNCLLEAYKASSCAKYYSCLLKLNDTLLSIQKKMSQKQREQLLLLIREEISIFNELVERLGVDLEVEE